MIKLAFILTIIFLLIACVYPERKDNMMYWIKVTWIIVLCSIGIIVALTIFGLLFLML